MANLVHDDEHFVVASVNAESGKRPMPDFVRRHLIYNCLLDVFGVYVDAVHDDYVLASTADEEATIFQKSFVTRAQVSPPVVGSEARAKCLSNELVGHAVIARVTDRDDTHISPISPSPNLAERFWIDNFKRNHELVAAADQRWPPPRDSKRFHRLHAGTDTNHVLRQSVRRSDGCAETERSESVHELDVSLRPDALSSRGAPKHSRQVDVVGEARLPHASGH